MPDKHQPSSPEQRKLAALYGKAHGYYGDMGGWIYKHGQPISHGWGQYWHRVGESQIVAWAIKQGIPVSAKLLPPAPAGQIAPESADQAP